MFDKKLDRGVLLKISERSASMYETRSIEKYVNQHIGKDLLTVMMGKKRISIDSKS